MMPRSHIYGMAVIYTLTLAAAIGLRVVEGFSVAGLVFALAHVWFHMGRMSAKPWPFPEGESPENPTPKWGR
jgi:hypothetical protein